MTNRPSKRSPGRPPASEGERHQARRRLLDAASKLIAERGYRGAAVNDVIAEAGLSKGAFYWHFESKDDLLFALIDERLDRPLRELIEQLKTAPSEQDLAPVASERFLELLDRNPETLVLEHEYRSLALRDPTLRKRYLQRQTALRDALAKGLSERAKRLGAPPFATPLTEIASVYLTLTHGLAIERLIDPEAVPDHLIGETVALIYQGLVARAERESEPPSPAETEG